MQILADIFDMEVNVFFYSMSPGMVFNEGRTKRIALLANYDGTWEPLVSLQAYILDTDIPRLKIYEILKV